MVQVYEHLGDAGPLSLWPLAQQTPALHANAPAWRTTLVLDASSKVSATWHPRRRIDITAMMSPSNGGGGAAGDAAGDGRGGRADASKAAAPPQLMRRISLQARDNAQHDLWLSGLMNARRHEHVYQAQSAAASGAMPPQAAPMLMTPDELTGRGGGAAVPAVGFGASGVATAVPLARGAVLALDHSMRTRSEGDDVLQALEVRAHA